MRRRLREAAARLERMEEVLRRVERSCFNKPQTIRVASGEPQTVYEMDGGTMRELRAALDEVVTPAPENRNATNATALQNHSETGTNVQSRSCPNAVPFCGGPDRYGDTCAACLATWTEEAKEKNA